MLSTLLGPVRRAFRNPPHSSRGQPRQRHQHPPVIEPLEGRIACGCAYPRLIVVQRGAAVVGSVIGADTSAAKADIVLVSQPGTIEQTATAQDDGSGPPYWSTAEHLIATSGPALP